jgi:hypothetical protein
VPGPESSSGGGSTTSGETKAAKRHLMRFTLFTGGIVSGSISLPAPTSEG